MIVMDKEMEFTDRIIDWYEKNGRNDLPWRSNEARSDPYKILMSEFMLQQTTAEQVKEIYPVFIDKFPSWKKLANANLNNIQEIVGKLGLKYRAERMKKTAVVVFEEYAEELPADYEKITELPGVGDYMAYSTLCYAFQESVPVVDTNIGRILNRVFSLKVNKRFRQSSELWGFADRITPDKNPDKYYYGLLDLGAKICHKNKPDCFKCPLNSLCQSKKVF